jgi:hypothetical protein
LVDSIQIVLVDMPQMLHDIVREKIEGAPGMRVAVDLADAEQLDGVVTRAHADVLIAGVEALDAGHVDRLLAESPRLTVLTIDREGRETVLYELRPHRRRLGEISPERLLDVVRRAGRVEA